jgi:hypothetical protein
VSVFESALASLNSGCLISLGKPVTYQPLAGAPFPLQIISRSPSILEDSSPGTYLYVWAQVSDFPSPPAKGDSLQIGAKHYTVYDLSADEGAGIQLTIQLKP